MIDKLNELCMWLSHQKGMMSQDYAKELAKIIVKLKQTKPLSDEEIMDIAEQSDYSPVEIEMGYDYEIRIARAIEERHGIK